MQVPWYFGENTPTLRHQRPQPEKQRQYSKLSEWFKKGVKEVGALTAVTMVMLTCALTTVNYSFRF